MPKEPKFVKTNVPGLEKDNDTGLVINRNTDKLVNFKNQREAVKAKKRLEAEVKQLRKDVDELKEYINKYSFGVMSDHPSWWVKNYGGCPTCGKPSDWTGKYSPYCGGDHHNQVMISYDEIDKYRKGS